MAACTSSRSLWSPCSSSSPFQSSWAAWNTWWLYWWQPCLGFLFVCFCLHSVLLTKMHFHGHASSICRAVVCIYLFIFGCIAGIPRTVCLSRLQHARTDEFPGFAAHWVSTPLSTSWTCHLRQNFRDTIFKFRLKAHHHKLYSTNGLPPPKPLSDPKQRLEYTTSTWSYSCAW